jgi:hypothetical protein
MTSSSSSSSITMRKVKSTLHQSLDVSLESLKRDVEAQAFSCDVSGRYAVLGDSAGLLLVVRSWRSGQWLLLIISSRQDGGSFPQTPVMRFSLPSLRPPLLHSHPQLLSLFFYQQNRTWNTLTNARASSIIKASPLWIACGGTRMSRIRTTWLPPLRLVCWFGGLTMTIGP